MQVYNAVTSSLAFWKRSLTVICYDEHGGFFDHVSPPLIGTNPPQGASYDAFTSLGPRIPGLLISPYVKAGGCVHNIFDHTSLLKLIGLKFGGGSYSDDVDSREVEVLSAGLNFDAPIANPAPAPAMNDYLAKQPKANPFDVTVPPPQTELQQAFREGTAEMKRQDGESHPTFGPLLQQVPN